MAQSYPSVSIGSCMEYLLLWKVKVADPVTLYKTVLYWLLPSNSTGWKHNAYGRSFCTWCSCISIDTQLSLLSSAASPLQLAFVSCSIFHQTAC